VTTRDKDSLIREHKHLHFRIGVLLASDDIGAAKKAADRMSAIQHELGMTEAEIQNL
jgi:hypothetical protein